MIRALGLSGIVALSACTPMSGDQITRSAARATVSKTLVNRYPDLPVEPALDCIIDNATSAELVGLASDALTGPTETTAVTVTTIARRPDTLRCFAARGLTLLSS